MAYSKIEPFGSRIEDLRVGTICSTIANAHRNAKTHPDPWVAEDFIYWADQARSNEPIGFEDPADQAQFVALSLFGVDLNKLKATSKGKKVTVKRKRN